MLEPKKKFTIFYDHTFYNQIAMGLSSNNVWVRSELDPIDLLQSVLWHGVTYSPTDLYQISTYADEYVNEYLQTIDECLWENASIASLENPGVTVSVDDWLAEDEVWAEYQTLASIINWTYEYICGLMLGIGVFEMLDKTRECGNLSYHIDYININENAGSIVISMSLVKHGSGNLLCM